VGAELVIRTAALVVVLGLIAVFGAFMISE
jgi:hypothetical protein